MTIQELIDQAFKVDPGLSIEVTDYETYTPNRGTVREVVALVGHKNYGSGSSEGITLRMRGDQVLGVVPGKTTMFWQAHRLVEAFHELQDRETTRAATE